MENELKKQNCPCCKLPTISKLGVSETCPVCEWRDDGKSTENTDEVIGTNGDYSLTKATKNFNRTKFMYSKSDSSIPNNPTFLRLQEELIELYGEFSGDINLNVYKFIQEVENKKQVTPKYN